MDLDRVCSVAAEVQPLSPPRAAVCSPRERRPRAPRNIRTFFEAERLGAKLDVVIFELPPLALLELDRDERPSGCCSTMSHFPLSPRRSDQTGSAGAT